MLPGGFMKGARILLNYFEVGGCFGNVRGTVGNTRIEKSMVNNVRVTGGEETFGSRGVVINSTVFLSND